MIKSVLTLPELAYYIEPGTLTMIIQVLIVCAISGLFMLRIFWGRVRALLVRLFRRDND